MCGRGPQYKICLYQSRETAPISWPHGTLHVTVAVTGVQGTPSAPRHSPKAFEADLPAHHQAEPIPKPKCSPSRSPSPGAGFLSSAAQLFCSDFYGGSVRPQPGSRVLAEVRPLRSAGLGEGVYLPPESRFPDLVQRVSSPASKERNLSQLSG